MMFFKRPSSWNGYKILTASIVQHFYLFVFVWFNDTQTPYSFRYAGKSEDYVLEFSF